MAIKIFFENEEGDGILTPKIYEGKPPLYNVIDRFISTSDISIRQICTRQYFLLLKLSVLRLKEEIIYIQSVYK